MAPAGVVNFIYKHLAEIQEELRGQIKVFVRHKASMVHLLELMLKTFKDNNNQAIAQSKDLRREAAKERAYECILNTRNISNKILSDLLKKADGQNSEMMSTLLKDSAIMLKHMRMPQRRNIKMKLLLKIENQQCLKRRSAAKTRRLT